eukprot:jgi/Undpi1/1140/HiC_scaffold_10.g04602.m1
MDEQDEGDAESPNAPLDTPFRQQRALAIQPIVTPAWVVGLFIAVGVLFVPFGTWLNLEYAKVVSIEQIYDGEGTTNADCSISASNEGKECEVTFTVGEDMEAPVYVYYELQKFYQNHRTYVKSRSYGQLKGGALSGDSCDPLATTGSLDLNPCGLVANSVFNDKFVVQSAPDPYDSSLPYEYMDESEISWVTDRDGDLSQPAGFVGEECALSASCEECLGSASYSDCQSYTDNRTGTNYKYWYPDEASTQYLYETYPDVISPVQGVSDEHFIVWMRTAALPTFRNLYGRIDHDLAAADTITFGITANFHVADFGGTKSLILTTLSPVGDRNGVLGSTFMVVGGASLAAGLVVLSRFQQTPRELADVTALA